MDATTHVLVLDYSIGTNDGLVIQDCIPSSSKCTVIKIDSESSFPVDLFNRGFSHVIHSGSAHSITVEHPYTKRAINFIREASNRGLRQMGICYGHQLICLAFNGKIAVNGSDKGLEAGWKNVHFNSQAQELLSVREFEKVWQHHFDEVNELPSGSQILASSDHTQIQAYINHEKKLLGTQFHPEFDLESGNDYFLNDRKFLENNGINVDEITLDTPSFDSRKVFFELFLEKRPMLVG